MTTEEETGIVQANVAEFGSKNLSPDTLEDSLKEGKKEEEEVISAAPLRSLDRIRDAILGLLEKNMSDTAKFYTESCTYLPLIVKASFAKKSNSTSSFRILLNYTKDTNRDFLKKYLVHEWGNSVIDTNYLDIFEKNKSRSNEELYLALFPELRNIPIINTEVGMIDNPYLFLLRAHVQRRAFYAGILEEAEKEKMLEIKSAQNGWTDTITHAAQVLTTNRILKYAKKVGEKNVVQYIEEIPEIIKPIQ